MYGQKLSELDLHVTNRCNLRCDICCFTSNELQLPELTLADIKRVLYEAQLLGCNEVHLTGGEPLLRNDLEEILSYALSLGLEVRLQTNGTLLTPEKAARLQRLGLRRIMVSLDSADKKTNDLCREKGAYDASVKAMKNAIQAGLDVRVNAVLTSITMDNFYYVALLAAELGIRKVSAFYFSPIGRGRRHFNLWVKPSEYMEKYNDVIDKLENERGAELPEDMDIILEKGYATWEETRLIDTSGFTGCGGGCRHMQHCRDYGIVRCDGNIYPCILTVDWPMSLGNIKDRALGEIWEDDQSWKMLDRGYASTLCQGCEHVFLCNGGCAGYAAVFSGDSSLPDKRCEYGKRVPLCPVMKYNVRGKKFGGSSDDVETDGKL